MKLGKRRKGKKDEDKLVALLIATSKTLEHIENAMTALDTTFNNIDTRLEYVDQLQDDLRTTTNELKRNNAFKQDEDDFIKCAGKYRARFCPTDNDMEWVRKQRQKKGNAH